MQPTPTLSRWPRILRTLVLGGALGLLQILLLSGKVMFSSWEPYVALGAFFYVLIPAFAGFLASRKEGGTLAGIGPGCLVAAIGTLIFVIAAVVVSVMALTTPRSACPPDCSRLYIDPLTAVLWLVFPVIVIEALGGVAGGMLGGLVGGFLGRATTTNR